MDVSVSTGAGTCFNLVHWCRDLFQHWVIKLLVSFLIQSFSMGYGESIPHHLEAAFLPFAGRKGSLSFCLGICNRRQPPLPIMDFSNLDKVYYYYYIIYFLRFYPPAAHALHQAFHKFKSEDLGSVYFSSRLQGNMQPSTLHALWCYCWLT